jgi:hypothetical protein
MSSLNNFVYDGPGHAVFRRNHQICVNLNCSGDEATAKSMAERCVRVADSHVICFDDACGLQKQGPIGFPRGSERVKRSERERAWPLGQYILNINNRDCHCVPLPSIWLGRFAG